MFSADAEFFRRLGAKGKSNGQQIGVRPLAAAPFRVNNEVLDL